MEQLVGFFDQEASRDYDQCVEDTQNWLREESDEPLPIRCVGVDCSEQAVQFAEEARLLDAGIAKNFEEGQEASEQEVRLMRHCNLMTSTGAIGYVTEKTLGAIFAHLGKALPEQRGPYMVMTILRLFDGELIKPVFQESGFHFERIPGVRLMQRRFADEAEQAKTLRALRERGVDAEGWETEGILYADLYAAAPRPDFEALWEAMTRTRNQLSTASETALET
jgi:hypothetical protein